ncbi:MAG: ferredoxin [Streptomyces sp.]|jgi:ferredoxin|nr:ferredoxin [Streptomyces sp.]
MKIQVDRNKCAGVGLCEARSPDHFEVGDDGMLELLQGDDIPYDRATEVEAAIRTCPTGALSRLA